MPHQEREVSAMFEVWVSERNGATLCQLAGDLESSTVSRFRQAFTGCLGRRAVVIDLSKLWFIDGAGLTALVGAVRRARERSCDIAVACAHMSLRKALVSAGLDQIVSLVCRTEDALAAVSASGTLASTPTSRVA
jgi:anti-anti-sigma factor